MLTRTSTAPIDVLPTSSSHNYGTVAYPALARHMSSLTPGYVPGAWGSTLPPAFAVPPEAISMSKSREAGTWPAPARVRGGGNTPPLILHERTSVSNPAGYGATFSPPPDPRAAAGASEAETARRHEEEREARGEEERRRNGRKPRLRMVLLPHATLQWFLVIASVNTRGISRRVDCCWGGRSPRA
ncbi:hypothetical protein B0H13DRAFT_839173 [Mycena leptocephala]|nr:hypothetical protein B0H13DRAFT_839173 [Mycena leptocephala]